MTDFGDDRPIKTDLQYLEQLQHRRLTVHNTKKPYLKKNQSSVIPCLQSKQVSTPQPLRHASKAQVYERIKRINRDRFGEEWRLKPQKAQEPKKQNKKLEPRKMTIGYLPKQIIDTEEYKKEGYIAKTRDIKTREHREQAGEPRKQMKADKSQKLEYSKMIEYLKRCYQQFAEEKEEFREQKSKLTFKKAISDQPGVACAIPSKVNKTQIKPVVAEHEKLGQSMNDLTGNASQEEQSKEATSLQYPIYRLHECSPFALRQITSLAELSEFEYDQNSLYRQAAETLQKYREEALVEMVGEKRISKFPNGWYEAWVPGKSRTAWNQHRNYKLVWYSNGDVRQDFNKHTMTYFCKCRKVSELRIRQQNVIWYFPELQQFETKVAGGKQVLYADGRCQFVSS